MANLWTAIKRLWRVGVVALIGAVAVEFMKLDWRWFLGALWKYLLWELI